MFTDTIAVQVIILINNWIMFLFFINSSFCLKLYKLFCHLILNSFHSSLNKNVIFDIYVRHLHNLQPTVNVIKN